MSVSDGPCVCVCGGGVGGEGGCVWREREGGREGERERERREEVGDGLRSRAAAAESVRNIRVTVAMRSVRGLSPSHPSKLFPGLCLSLCPSL